MSDVFWISVLPAARCHQPHWQRGDDIDDSNNHPGVAATLLCSVQHPGMGFKSHCPKPAANCNLDRVQIRIPRGQTGWQNPIARHQGRCQNRIDRCQARCQNRLARCQNLLARCQIRLARCQTRCQNQLGRCQIRIARCQSRCQAGRNNS